MTRPVVTTNHSATLTATCYSKHKTQSTKSGGGVRVNGPPHEERLQRVRSGVRSSQGGGLERVASEDVPPPPPPTEAQTALHGVPEAPCRSSPKSDQQTPCGTLTNSSPGIFYHVCLDCGPKCVCRPSSTLFGETSFVKVSGPPVQNTHTQNRWSTEGFCGGEKPMENPLV